MSKQAQVRGSWIPCTAGLVLAAAGGGAMVILAWLPALAELQPIFAGAACVGVGAVVRRPVPAYLAGVVFALVWGLASQVAQPIGALSDVLPLVLAAGLLALGPVAALGAVLCGIRCPGRSDLINGGA